MRRIFTVLALLFLSLAFAIPSQAQDKVELFGGYSYVRATLYMDGTILCPASACPLYSLGASANMNGWEASGVYKLSPRVGIAVDGSGHNGSGDSNSVYYGTAASKANLYTYLIGPQIALRERGRFQPYFHVLAGGANENTTTTSPNPIVVVRPTHETALAVAIGGGVDFRLTPRLWLRPLQVDYLVTTLGSSAQNQPRISAGLVFRF